mmetsp:Transcript_18253/g.20294  ORF Transcript_18253/g.20294 Transcript_18253/m.20294 type:complete len:137 (+) Transcript_18253:33-443(+)
MAETREGANNGSLPYKWNQTLKEVTLTIDLKEATRGKQMDIQITKNHIKVKKRGETECIVDGDLHKAIRTGDTQWYIEDQVSLVIELFKVNQMEWWACVCVGDPEVDTTKIEPESSKLGDLDGESRAMVEKMMASQ